VAFNGTNYLITWSQDSTGGQHDIYGVRMSPQGKVLNEMAIAYELYDESLPKVASDGADFLVTWEGKSDTTYHIYGARVSASGVVFDIPAIPISGTTGGQGESSVAFGGSSYFVVWNDNRSGLLDIYGARVSPNGIVTDTHGIPISTATSVQIEPTITFDGTNFLVAWTDGRSGTSYDIYGARVTANGSVLDPSGIPISTAPGSQSEPSVAFNGSYLVIWNDRRSGTGTDLYGGRVTTAGSVPDANGFMITQSVGDLAPLSATRGPGNKWGVAYSRAANVGTGIYTRTVAPK
jgi:hypothetical protein